MNRKPKVVITHVFHKKIIDEKLRPKAKVHICSTAPQLRKELQDADALISYLTVKIGPREIERAENLKVIGNYGSGVNNIDLEYCRERKVKVVNTPKVVTRSTAELTLALTLATLRRFYEGSQMCRDKKFKGWGDHLLGYELRNRKVILLGKGNIGKQSARLFKAFGAHVDWILKNDSEKTIQKKLAQAQVLSIHVPLNSSTHHWLNKRRIALLPSDAVIINTARGPIIDEEALAQALKKKRIFGAGLDVFEWEPKISKNLLKLSNVTLLPHLGTSTAETRRAMADLVVQGVLKVLGGQRPWNQVRLTR